MVADIAIIVSFASLVLMKLDCLRYLSLIAYLGLTNIYLIAFFLVTINTHCLEIF